MIQLLAQQDPCPCQIYEYSPFFLAFRLLRHPQERAYRGAAAEACVRTRFTLEAGIERLATKFGLAKVSEPCALRSMRR